jgi:nitrate reductase NapD
MEGGHCVTSKKEFTGDEDFNVCGVLVHARRERMAGVAEALETLSGVEVHQRTGDGRLIITIEDTPQRMAGETLAGIHKIDGVLSASLVYHQTDPETSMEETQQ